MCGISSVNWSPDSITDPGGQCQWWDNLHAYVYCSEVSHAACAKMGMKTEETSKIESFFGFEEKAKCCLRHSLRPPGYATSQGDRLCKPYCCGPEPFCYSNGNRKMMPDMYEGDDKLYPECMGLGYNIMPTNRIDYNDQVHHYCPHL
jgi:hypothetical protein